MRTKERLDFEEWFEHQYGGLPDPRRLAKRLEELDMARDRLRDIQRDVDREHFLQQTYTAALYARNAFVAR